MLQLSLWGKKEESFVLGAGFFLRVDVLIHWRCYLTVWGTVGFLLCDLMKFKLQYLIIWNFADYLDNEFSLIVFIMQLLLYAVILKIIIISILIAETTTTGYVRLMSFEAQKPLNIDNMWISSFICFSSLVLTAAKHSYPISLQHRACPICLLKSY